MKYPEHFEKLQKNDPEFAEQFAHFAFDEVPNNEDAKLPPRTRYMAILAVLLGSSEIDAYKEMLPLALDNGLTPVEVKEIVYQAVAYLGMGRVYPFFKATNKVFKKRDIKMPLEPQTTTTYDDRREKGTQAQVDIFGDVMQDFWKKGTVNYWLADNCFGDYYTRKGLTLAERELVTFCFIYAQGGCENQLHGHTNGNLRMGNDREFLTKVVLNCVPFMGYPRSLNAIAVINEVADQYEKAQNKDK